MLIDVNGKKFTVNGPSISYEQVCELAGFPSDRATTVVYNKRCGCGGAAQHGTLVPKQLLVVKDGTRFTVADTSGA